MAEVTALTTEEGFLGVTNSQYRDAGLSMELARLAEAVRACLFEQCAAVRRGLALTELAAENLPQETDCDKVDAVLAAMRPTWMEVDKTLCAFGGYFEALIVRAQEAQHG